MIKRMARPVAFVLGTIILTLSILALVVEGFAFFTTYDQEEALKPAPTPTLRPGQTPIQRLIERAGLRRNEPTRTSVTTIISHRSPVYFPLSLASFPIGTSFILYGLWPVALRVVRQGSTTVRRLHRDSPSTYMIIGIILLAISAYGFAVYGDETAHRGGGRTPSRSFVDTTTYTYYERDHPVYYGLSSAGLIGGVALTTFGIWSIIPRNRR